MIFFEGESDEGAVEVAMQYNASYQESVVLVRQQHQHARRRRAPVRLPLGTNAHAEPLRAQKGMLKERDENLTGEDIREGLTAVIVREALRPAVRGPDEDQARQPGGGGLRRVGRQRRGWPSSSRRTPAMRRRSCGRRCRPPRPARPPARPATGDAKVRDAAGMGCPASSPTARSQEPRALRAVHRRGRLRRRLGRSRAATARPRRSCRCAARS